MLKSAEEVAREMVSDLGIIADDYIRAALLNTDEACPARGILVRLIRRSRAEVAATEPHQRRLDLVLVLQELVDASEAMWSAESTARRECRDHEYWDEEQWGPVNAARGRHAEAMEKAKAALSMSR